MATALDRDFQTYRTERETAWIDELARWIAVPSVSADPARADDVRACCALVIERLRDLGFETAILETGGHPIAYGRHHAHPGAPTLLIYGHYDVQPADPEALWTTSPFALRVRDGKMYGRGSADDKGQVFMHLAALETHLRVRGRLPVNVTVVVEGEEEIGSPHFDQTLVRERERFAADVAVISDTAFHAAGIPSLTTSVRGLVSWEIAVHGPSGDLHSGYFGGTVANPIEALARLVAQMKDAHGHIVIPGFYEGVRELDRDQRAEIAALPFDAERMARDLGVPALHGEPEYTPLERMWYRPTLECNGIWGGYQGPGTKTIIPAFARAKLTARLVAGQDPHRVRDALIAFVRRMAPPGVRVEVESAGDVPAVATARDHPAVRAAARALEAAFGRAPVMIGTGGSIGPVASFARVFEIPQVLMGFGLPDDAIHAPDERFDLDQFRRGIDALAFFYDELART